MPDHTADGDLITVITTLLGLHEVSGMDLATAYHDRWAEEPLYRRALGRTPRFGQLKSSGYFGGCSVGCSRHVKTSAQALDRLDHEIMAQGR